MGSRGGNETYRCEKCSFASWTALVRFRGPHIGAYCERCGQWIKWIQKRDAEAIGRLRDRSSPARPSRPAPPKRRKAKGKKATIPSELGWSWDTPDEELPEF